MKTLVAAVSAVVTLVAAASIATGSPSSTPSSSSSSSHGHPDPAGGLSFMVWACGAKTCNCTDRPAEVTLCDTTTVTVSAGGGTPITISTGSTSSNCAKKNVASGQCFQKCWKVICEKTWLGFLNCYATGDSALKVTPAGPDDCP